MGSQNPYAHLGIAPRSAAGLLPALASTTSLGTGIPSDPLLPEEYPNVRFWTTEAYRERNLNGAKRLDVRSPWSVMYLEDEAGIPLPGAQRSAIYTQAYAIWNGMKKKGIVPQIFSRSTSEEINQFTEELEQQFPILRLCSNHYKAHEVWKTNFSTWQKRSLGTVVKTEDKSGTLQHSEADLKHDRPPSPDLDLPNKRRVLIPPSTSAAQIVDPLANVQVPTPALVMAMISTAAVNPPSLELATHPTASALPTQTLSITDDEDIPLEYADVPIFSQPAPTLSGKKTAAAIASFSSSQEAGLNALASPPPSVLPKLKKAASRQPPASERVFAPASGPTKRAISGREWKAANPTGTKGEFERFFAGLSDSEQQRLRRLETEMKAANRGTNSRKLRGKTTPVACEAVASTVDTTDA